MSIINVTNLTFSYPGSYENIFENVSFQIDTDWKLGFIGRNGRGKTTFFNLLLKKYEYRGTIQSSVSFDYFPYQISAPDRMTLEILQEISPQIEDWEFMRELSYLEMNAEILYQDFSLLSNGEQTKVLLCALFLKEGHFLLIDEPTNHLDLHAREIVASYLQKKKGFILISHDRHFLDQCVDHILSINRSDITVQKGNFSSWWENRQRQEQFELGQQDKLQREVKQLRAAAMQSANWSDKTEKSKRGTTNSGSKLDKGFVGHKAAKMMKRSKNLESRQQKAIEEKASLLKNQETTDSLKISPLIYHASSLVHCENLSSIYGGKVISDPITFDIKQGDRIALDGDNGSGKSSILKRILKEYTDYDGTLEVGSGLQISYVSQDASTLSGSLSDFAEKQGIDKTLFFTILRKLDFERSLFDQEMQYYSGGQKKKVLLAKSLCESAHLYIWDEPLNFIDIYSRMQIEELILQYQPTMIFIEHDKRFREKISTKEVHILKKRD